MTAKKIDKKILIVASAVILLAVFVPWNQASALLDIGSITTNALNGMIVGILYAIFTVIGTFLGWVATLLNGLIQLSTSQYPDAVQASWAIVKNFVNMFFILALIIMAGATIFDVKNYNYEKLLVPFLIIAVLINFSFAITNYIVSVGNGLTGIMTNQIGDVGGRLGQGFEMVFNGISTGNVKSLPSNLAGNYMQMMMALIFGIIFAAIALLALVASMIFVIARTVVIWILLIVAPIAWFCYIFPGLRKNWTKWWDYLISWTFFLPVYLFFLSFAFIFLNESNTYQASRIANAAAASSGMMYFFSGSFNTLIFYCVTIFFMVYGLKAAFDVGSLASNGVKGAFGKIEGGIKRVSGYSSLEKAVKATGGKVVEEGLPGKLKALYGGAQAERQRTSRFTEAIQSAFGYKPTFAAQKEFLSNANKEHANVKQQFDLGRLSVDDIRNRAKQNADKPEGFAYRKMLAEVGQLDAPMVRETLLSLRGNPYAAVDFIKAAAKTNFSAVPANDLIQMAAAEGAYTDLASSTSYLPARKEIYKFIQSNAKIARSLGYDQFEKGVSIMGGATSSDGTSFIKEMGKFRPDLAADYIIANPPPGATPRTREQIISSYLSSAESIVSIPLATWRQPDFARAFWDKLNTGSPRTRTNYRSNLERFVLDSGAADVADKLLIITNLSTNPRP